MTRQSLSHAVAAACLAMPLAFALVTPSAAWADWLYDFNSSPGDTFFVFPNYNQPGQPPPPTFEYSFGDGVFRMFDNNPLSAGGAERAKALDSEVFSDVRVTAVINPNGETTHGYLGLVTRSSIAVPSTGYWAALNAESNRGRLYLGKAVLGNNVSLIGGSIQVPNFATQYLLQLDAINKEEYVEVVGVLRDYSSGQQIDRLEFQDHGTPQLPQLRSGTSGVFGGISQSNLNLTFGTASSVIMPALAGDYSGNGTVGPEDYSLWKADFGSTTILAADGNGNRIVDAADYTVWRNNLGATLLGGGSAGASPSHAGVPEPTTVLTLLLGSTVVPLFNWRGKRERRGPGLIPPPR